MLKQLNPNLRNFLIGGVGFLTSLLAGCLLIYLLGMIDFGGWVLNMVDQSQLFQRILALPLIAGLMLALGGFVIGGGGGWVLGGILGTQKRLRLLIGAGLAFALTFSLLTLLFLLLITFIALYNNLTTDPVGQYGLLFGLFGFVFGLVVGLLLALLTVHLRHSWRVLLAAIAGFTLGGVVLGLLVNVVNPTAGYQTYPILTTVILLLALAAPFFFGGGALGVVYGWIARRAQRDGAAVEAAQNPRWQAVVVGVVGAVLALLILSRLGTINDFLAINPANLKSQLPVLTVGVAWSEAQPARLEPGSEELPPVSSGPTVVTGPDQLSHQAWCSEAGVVNYQAGSQAAEQVPFPGCLSAPVLAFGDQDQPHLVWYAAEIEDTNGVIRPASLLVESIRTEAGWSAPAIAAHTDQPAYLSLLADAVGNLQLAWAVEDQAPMAAFQDVYECSPEDLPRLMQLGYEAILAGEFYPPGTQIPFCQNEYQQIMYTPNPQPAYSDVPATENGAFDQIAGLVDDARYELLFTTMQYEPDTDPPSPGSVLAQEVYRLYRLVSADPQAYPRGMTVRIMLGNYPEMANFSWGDQIYDVLADLRVAGLPEMVNPEIGWRLEVANYPGTYPHSHTKFVVVDGRTVAGAGFNYGYLHLPVDHPSGKGYDMLDLALQIDGPVAQTAISAYDDMWAGANQIHCESLSQQDENWLDSCQELTAVADHPPEVLRTYLPPDGDSNAFSLYRSQVFKETDQFVYETLAAAEESIDLLHVNFSLDMICMANIVFPDLCTIEDALPYMDALLLAIEGNDVQVRVIMENTNSNGLENRVAANVFLQEVQRRGLEDQVDLRFYNGKIHAKGTLIDESLLMIGSFNMHYSSWGENGLTEFVLATDDPQAVAEFKALYETKWAEAIPYDEAVYATSP